MTPEIPPRSVRRRHVILLFASYPAGVLLLHALLDGSRWYSLSHIVMTIAILYLLAIERVGRVGKRIADDRDDRLDERQLALRNAAYTDAYRLVSGVAVLGVIWMALATDNDLWYPRTYEEWNDIVWGLGLLATSLPSALLCWREPDRVEDAEPEPQHA